MPRVHLRDGLAVAFSTEEEAERDAEEAADAARRGRAPSYRELRAIAYRDELGKERGDFIRTLGDVLDVLILEIRARGEALTPESAALFANVDEIKRRFPRVEP